MKKLENKTAVITGGAGSIGKATAALFLEEGAKVLLIDLDEEALKQTAAELGNENISWCAADVSNTDDVKRYANEAKKTFGSVDIFFNCPAYGRWWKHHFELLGCRVSRHAQCKRLCCQQARHHRPDAESGL